PDPCDVRAANHSFARRLRASRFFAGRLGRSPRSGRRFGVQPGDIARRARALPARQGLAAAELELAAGFVNSLPTRLSAVDEAATLDVLCSDKTGTLTLNDLTVTALRPEPGFDEPHLLAMAALASSDGGQDPVDAAIRAASARQPIADPPTLTKLVPFDPANKLSDASGTDAKGGEMRAVKGAFAVVSKLAETS